jgi:hypothetical protein
MAAVKMLKSRAEKNIWAVELGNEPDSMFYFFNNLSTFVWILRNQQSTDTSGTRHWLLTNLLGTMP